MHAQTKNRLPCIDKTFSIVVHIVRDSLGNPSHAANSILANIASLNNEFAPICVSFEVCFIDSIDNFRYNDIKDQPNPNHWKEMQVLYHVKNRINIYYVKEITVPGGANGFAGLESVKVFDKSGIVIKGPGIKTLAHEMGHYFGLLHTFEPGGELVDGSNCSTASDGICDTPPDPFVDGDNTSDYVDANCKFISMKKDGNGQYYNPIVGNIMSYYPSTCKCTVGQGFTHDQYLRMANTYLSNPGMW